MIFEILSIFLVSIGSVISFLIFYARRHYGSLESFGIPVLKPYFILGSQPNLNELIIQDEDMKNYKKFGSTWGMYQGRQPVIFISDPEQIRKIFIRDSDHFPDMRRHDYGDPYTNELLGFLPYHKWKIIRGKLNPYFASNKIKYMTHNMNESAREFSNYLSDRCKPSAEMDIRDFYLRMTTDVASKSFFGTKIKGILEPDNIFMTNIRKLNFSSDNMTYMLSISMTFPFLAKIKPLIPNNEVKYIINFFQQLMAQRKLDNPSGVKNDFLDGLLDIEKDLESNPLYLNEGITIETILAQALTIIIAGYDTKTTVLSMLTYLLAKHPEIDEKVNIELGNFFAKYEEINLENLRDLPYLAACIQEALRLYPPVVRTERECQKDWTDPDTGLAIKKGMAVRVSSYAIHHDPELWGKNPENFYPERFLTESKSDFKFSPYSFVGFGFGPHLCIGMKFANVGMLIASALILKDYRFEVLDKTEVKFKPGCLILVQQKPIVLKVIKRNEE